MYLWRGVLFTGDVLVRSKQGLAPSPFLFSEDDAQSRASLRRLRDVNFSQVADRHAGLTVDAWEQLHVAAIGKFWRPRPP